MVAWLERRSAAEARLASKRWEHTAGAKHMTGKETITSTALPSLVK